VLKAVTTLLIRELVQIHATVTAGREADKRREREREQRGSEERQRDGERDGQTYTHTQRGTVRGTVTVNCQRSLRHKVYTIYLKPPEWKLDEQYSVLQTNRSQTLVEQKTVSHSTCTH